MTHRYNETFTYKGIFIGFLVLISILSVLTIWTIALKSSAATAISFTFDDDSGLTLGTGIEVTGGMARLSDQSLVVDWQQNYDGTGDDYDMIFSVARDSSDNIYVAGAVGNANFDFFVRKYNSSGVFQWEDVVDGAAGGNDTASKVKVDGDGNIVAIGFTLDAPGDTNWLIKKYDTDGTPIFTETVNGTDFVGDIDFPYDLAFDASNNVYVTGNKHSGGSPVFHTNKYAPSGGAPLWEHSGNGYFGTNIVIDNDGNPVTLSFTDSSQTAVVEKLSAADGSSTWENIYLGQVYRDMAVDSANNVILAGSNDGTSDSDWYIRKLEPDGDESWLVNYAGTGQDQAESLLIDASDNIYVGGAYSAGTTTAVGFGGPFTGNFVYKIVRLNSAGSETWEQNFSSIDTIEAYHEVLNVWYTSLSDIQEYESNIQMHFDSSGDIVAAMSRDVDDNWYAVRINSATGAALGDGGPITDDGSAKSKVLASVLDSTDNLIAAGFSSHVDVGTSYTDATLAKYELGYSTLNPILRTDTNYVAESLTSFLESLSGGSTGNMTYQLSVDGGTTWYWYSGGWTVVNNSLSLYSQSNSASTLDTNFGTFPPAEPKALQIRMFFNSNGTQPVELQTLTVESGDSGTASFTFGDASLYNLSASSIAITSGELNLLDTFSLLGDDTQTDSEIQDNYATDVTITPDGYIYSLITKNGTARYPVIMKYDSDGNLIDSFAWDPTGGTNHVNPRAIDHDGAGNLYVTGDQFDPVEGESKIFVIKVDTTSFPPVAPDWFVYFQDADVGSVGDWKGKDISVTNDDTFVYVGGTCKEGLVAGYKFCITKLDTSDGSVDTTWNTTYSATSGVRLIAPGGSCDDASFIDTTGISIDGAGDVYLYGDCSQACEAPGQAHDQETNGCGGGGGGA